MLVADRTPVDIALPAAQVEKNTKRWSAVRFVHAVERW
jgi:hypothetical protein